VARQERYKKDWILLAKSAAFGPAAALSGFPIRRPPMSLRPQPLPPVPDDTARIDTARIAQTAFRRSNPYVLLCDRLGAVFAVTAAMAKSLDGAMEAAAHALRLKSTPRPTARK
jgi:hypothetical protein